MVLNLWKKIQVANVAIVLCLAPLFADQSENTIGTREEFVDKDPSALFLRVSGDPKYPYVIKHDPILNQWSMVLLGVQHNKASGVMQQPEDLEWLIPLRFMLKNAESGIKVDKKYPGFRSVDTAFVGVALEKLLVPNERYKGKILIDEYLKTAKGEKPCSMKWVMKDLRYFRAIRNYMIRELIATGMQQPPAKKPLLMVELLDGSTFNDDDKLFLNTLFDYRDKNDPAAIKFFNDAQKRLNGIIDSTHDAKQVGESMGEALLHKLEDANGEFDIKKLAVMDAGAIFISLITKPVQSIFEAGIAKVSDVLGLPSKAKSK